MGILEKLFWTWLFFWGAILCYGIYEIEKDTREYRWRIAGIWLALGALLGLYRIWFN